MKVYERVGYRIYYVWKIESVMWKKWQSQCVGNDDDVKDEVEGRDAATTYMQEEVKYLYAMEAIYKRA